MLNRSISAMPKATVATNVLGEMPNSFQLGLFTIFTTYSTDFPCAAFPALVGLTISQKNSGGVHNTIAKLNR